MRIPTNEIEFKRAVGKVKGKVLWHVKTRGGLHLMALDGGEVVGAASHRAVARHIAQQHEPGLEWTELSKGEWAALSDYEFCLPEYQELTDRMRTLQKKTRSGDACD
jgi:hypothetical protein